MLPLLFLLVLLQHGRRQRNCHHLLCYNKLFFCCNSEGNDNNATITFCFGLVVAKKVTIELQQSCHRLLFLFCYNIEGDGSKATIAFCFRFATIKKATTMSHCLILWFHHSEEEEDDNFCHLLWWLCCKKMATYAFFGGFATKKVMTAMSLPSSMVVVLWRRQWQ